MKLNLLSSKSIAPLKIYL